MLVYLLFIKNSFASNLKYKFNSLFGVFSRLIFLFMHLSIWSALFRTVNNSVAAGAETISLRNMLTYTVVSFCMEVMIDNSIIEIINERIGSGQVAMDLIKPFNLMANLLCVTIGNNIYNIIIEGVPYILIGLLLYNMNLPDFSLFGVFIVSLINSFIIYFLLSYIIALSGFWYLRIGHFRRFLNDVMKIFSGTWIPLWFFPGFLIKITGLLPFPLIFFEPITIYLGKKNHLQAFQVIYKQFFWIVILFILGQFVWQKAQKKIVIQGG